MLYSHVVFDKIDHGIIRNEAVELDQQQVQNLLKQSERGNDERLMIIHRSGFLHEYVLEEGEEDG